MINDRKYYGQLAKSQKPPQKPKRRIASAILIFAESELRFCEIRTAFLHVFNPLVSHFSVRELLAPDINDLQMSLGKIDVE